MALQSRWMPGAVLPLLATITCSDAEHPVRSDTSGRSPSPPPAPQHGHAPEAPDLGGPVSLPIPPNNGVGLRGAVGWTPVARIPRRTFVHVVVEGGVTVTSDVDEWCGDALPSVPLAGRTVGPLGEAGEFRVGLRYRPSSGASSYLNPRAVGGAALRAERAAYLGPGEIQARRTGGGETCSEAIPGSSERIDRAAYQLGGSQTVHARALNPVVVHADRASVGPGDTITFRLGGPLERSEQEWRWAPGDTAAAPRGAAGSRRVCGNPRRDVCRIAAEEGGRMYVRAVVRNVRTDRIASEPVRVVEELPEVAVESLSTSGTTGSFTTAPDEARITAAARVSPEELIPSLRWTVRDDPADRAESAPPGDPPPGTPTSWTVPAHPLDRWRSTHHETANELDRKSLGYEVVAWIEKDGRRYESPPRRVRQDEIDTIRQEYLDLGRSRVPERADLLAGGAGRFSSGELNFGDYDRYLATPELVAGLEALEVELERTLELPPSRYPGLTVTSGYRNPVHHSIHVGARSSESQHQYGTAADLRIWGFGDLTRERVFRAGKEAAKILDACWEPEEVIRAHSRDGSLTHAHIDWRRTCPREWQS